MLDQNSNQVSSLSGSQASPAQVTLHIPDNDKSSPEIQLTDMKSAFRITATSVGGSLPAAELLQRHISESAPSETKINIEALKASIDNYLEVKTPWYKRHFFARAAFLGVLLASVVSLVFLPFALIAKFKPSLNYVGYLLAAPLLFGVIIPIVSIIGFLFPGSVGKSLTRSIVFPAVVDNDAILENKRKRSKYRTQVNLNYQWELLQGYEDYNNKITVKKVQSQYVSECKKAEAWDIEPKAGADNTIIYFCGNGYPFQSWEKMAELMEVSSELGVNIRVFNYPAVTNILKDDENFMKAAIKEGILQVYDVISKRGLDVNNPNHKQAIIDSCRLHAHSTGGGIALHVALYFQQQHDINLFVMQDRSFSSFAAAMGAQIANSTGMFFALTRRLSQLLLYAMGDSNIDNMAAYEKLKNKKRIDYFNAAQPGRANADKVILDDATFANGVAALDKSALSPANGGGVLQSLAKAKSSHVLIGDESDTDYHTAHLVTAWRNSFDDGYEYKAANFCSSTFSTEPAIERIRRAATMRASDTEQASVSASTPGTSAPKT